MRTKRSDPSGVTRFIYGGLIVAGFILLDWVGCTLLMPDPAPYHYELISEGPIASFPELGLEGPETLHIRKLEVRADGADVAAAVLHVADPSQGAPPILLEWRNQTARPLLTLSPRLTEVSRLAQATAEHVPERAVMLAWWDTARQLKLLAGVDILFDENLGQPLLIPRAWSGRQESIEELERIFWQVSGDNEPLFARYVDALLSEPGAGAAMLGQLVGERQAFAAVHLIDAYKLGALRPESFGIGFRDFPGAGEVHGQVRHVKEWLDDNGYRSYVVEQISTNVNRVYFLTDRESENTLIARMLPFSTSNPARLEAPRLVSNYGGFWVYVLPGAGAVRMEEPTPGAPQAD